MAALAASDVSYTVVKLRKGIEKNENQMKVAFGDGVKTYPAGGIPLTKGKLGCPVNLESLIIVDSSADGFVYKFDQVNGKIRIYQGDNANAAAAPGVELGGADTPAATALLCLAIGV